MLLVVAILVLTLVGVIPLDLGAPVGIGGLGLALTTEYLFSRRMNRLPVQTGREAMVGQGAATVTQVDFDGTVRYANELWRARTRDGRAIPAGHKVRIESIQGLRLTVEPAASDGRG